MELSILKQVFFIGTEDAIDTFIAALKPRCIKPTSEAIEEDGHTVKLIFNSDNDTFISPTMRTYKKCPHCGRIEPADTFRTVTISQVQRRIPEGRSRRVSTETVCSHCACYDGGHIDEPLPDDLYLVMDSRGTDHCWLYADDPHTQWYLGTDDRRHFFDNRQIYCYESCGFEPLAYLDANGIPQKRTLSQLRERFNEEVKYADSSLTQEVFATNDYRGIGYKFLRDKVENDHEHFEQCPNCQTWYAKSAHAVSDGRCIKCSRMTIYDYHCWDGSLDFKHVDGEPSTGCYFGTEVETEGNEDNSSCVAPYADLWHLEHDSSLGYGSFEMISQPMTWAYMKSRYADIDNMFKKLINAGQMGNDAPSGRCGLHVHVSAAAFKNEEAIRRAVIIVNAFKANMQLFARRRANRYCAYTGTFTLAHVQHLSEDVYQTIDVYGHGCAVNVANHHHGGRKDTIEFRIFKSTLKAETYFAAVEFVKNIVAVANDTAKKKIYFKDLIYGEYVPAYVEERRTNHGAYFDMDASIDFTFSDVKKAFEAFERDETHSFSRLVSAALQYAATNDGNRLTADELSLASTYVAAFTQRLQEIAAENSEEGSSETPETSAPAEGSEVSEASDSEVSTNEDTADISGDTSVSDEPVVIPFAR